MFLFKCFREDSKKLKKEGTKIRKKESKRKQGFSNTFEKMDYFQCKWRGSGVFIVNFKHISHLALVFLILIMLLTAE